MGAVIRGLTGSLVCLLALGRYLFLFDKVVIVCKRKGYNYELKEIIELFFHKMTDDPMNNKDIKKVSGPGISSAGELCGAVWATPWAAHFQQPFKIESELAKCWNIKARLSGQPYRELGNAYKRGVGCDPLTSSLEKQPWRGWDGLPGRRENGCWQQGLVGSRSRGVGQGGMVPGKGMPVLPPACQNQHSAKEHHFASGLGFILWPWRKTSSQVSVS